MESVYLGCFLFGILMVVASVALGFAHLALPGGHNGVHVGHGNGHAHGHGNGHGNGGEGSRGLPIWNISSLLAFLMWFGAGGYAVMKLTGIGPWLALVPAVAAGAAGAVLVSAFLRLMLRGETEMDPAQYRMEGTLAKVTIGIPEGGTGEIIFSKGDSRRSEGARSIDGRPIARGEEVVVVDYQRGIALVQGWDEFKSDA
jgi:membrane protein implicated in regulation of membrane protease activity